MAKYLRTGGRSNSWAPHFVATSALSRDGDGDIAEIDWCTPEDLPGTEIMPIDLLVIRYALSPTTTLLVD